MSRAAEFVRFPCALAALAGSLAVLASTAEAGSIRRLSHDRTAPVVELFEGLDQGRIEARVVPSNEFHAHIFLTNTTQQPLTVQLPAAAAAVHVLKQAASGFIPPGPLGLPGQTAQATLGAGQAAAGQLFPSGPQSGTYTPSTPFDGTQFFSIPAEKTVQVEFQSVCLDHGKPSPMPRMTYVLRPLSEHTPDVALRRLIESADFVKTNRRILQAAAWNLSSEMDWKQLRAKTVDRGAGIRVPYLTKKQLDAAKRLVEQAREPEAEATEERIVRK